MTGIEINMVVRDCLAALSLYEQFFEVERIEVSRFPVGTNEAVFSIYGTRFHMLDENPQYQLIAPKPGQAMPMWVNVLVPDIKSTYEKAIASGCVQIQPVTEMEAFGISNAIFTDPFGYIWMLHQIHREVSYEERIALLEPEFGKENPARQI